MLKNLRIRNFRMLEDLEIPQLGRINLIVGKNNSGKSSILEALRIYAGNANPTLLRDILSIHDEAFNLDDLYEYENTLQNWSAIKHLFPNRKLPGKNSIILEIGPNKKSLSMEHVFYYMTAEEIRDDDNEVIDVRTRRIFISESDFNEISESEDVKSAIRIKLGPRTTIIDLDEDLRKTRVSPLSSIRASTMNCSFVPTEFLSSEILASLWDKIALSSNEDTVLDALKIIDNNLERLAFIEDPNRISSRDNSRLAIVTLKGSENRIPLNSMGDGVSRILQLILLVFPARDGILLIDEFENGLHFSVQEEVWKIIFELARRLNIQVFATTHSWDCIESFSKVANENNEDGVLIKLSRSKLTSDKGKVKATIYSEDDLKNITTSSLEVR